MVPLSPCDLPLLGCLLAWTFILAPSSFSLPFLGAFFLWSLAEFHDHPISCMHLKKWPISDWGPTSPCTFNHFCVKDFSTLPKTIAQLHFTHISFFPNTIASLGNLVRLFIPVYPVIKKMVGYQQGSQGRLLIISIRPCPFGIYSIETHRDTVTGRVFSWWFFLKMTRKLQEYIVCENLQP